MSPTAARHSSDAAIDPLWQLQVLLTQGLLFWISPLVFILVHIALVIFFTVGHPLSTTRKAQLLDWFTAARNRLYEASSGLLRFLLWNVLLGVLRSRQGAIYANAILRQQQSAYEDDKAGRYSDTPEVAARDRVIQKLSKALEWERARSTYLSAQLRAQERRKDTFAENFTSPMMKTAATRTYSAAANAGFAQRKARGLEALKALRTNPDPGRVKSVLQSMAYQQLLHRNHEMAQVLESICAR